MELETVILNAVFQLSVSSVIENVWTVGGASAKWDSGVSLQSLKGGKVVPPTGCVGPEPES